MFRDCLSLTLVVALLSVFTLRPAEAADPLDADTVKAALHTATAEEEGFVEHVVDLVGRGKLPRELFDSTFLWAKRKPRNKFQYFKRALILRAEREGIRL